IDASSHLSLKIPTMQNFGNGTQVATL
ncbi:hypothetical protein C265_21994, partial [Cupriavidus sp. GA3-3]